MVKKSADFIQRHCDNLLDPYGMNSVYLNVVSGLELIKSISGTHTSTHTYNSRGLQYKKGNVSAHQLLSVTPKHCLHPMRGEERRGDEKRREERRKEKTAKVARESGKESIRRRTKEKKQGEEEQMMKAEERTGKRR